MEGRIPGQRLFCTLCFLAYFSTYLGRLNFTASLGEIAAATGFTKPELGLVSSGFFMGYGVFQLVWGLAGDRHSPVKLVFGGIFASGALNLAMAAARSPGVMAALWLCNGIAQSAVWSPLLRLTVEVLPPRAAQQTSIRYSAAVPLGTLATYGLCGLCAALHAWRAAFLGAGVILIAVSLVWLVSMAPLDPPAAMAGSVRQLPPFPRAAVALLIPTFLAAAVNGLLRDSVQTWMPTYLQETYGLSTASSILFTLVLPVVNLSGVYLSGWANRQVFRNELSTAMAAFLCGGLLLGLNAALGLPLGLSLALFGLCGAMMLAANTMLVTFVPLGLHRTGRVSALSGILNAATYLGSTLSGYGAGRLLERSTWTAALGALSLGALAAAGLCIAAAGKWTGLRR
ncbi:MAG: MFS transporter [Eubacteriales bacterium]|nr:MFS transporter [Eubacteriales bacterium]